MKIIYKLVSWFKKRYNFYTSSKFTFEIKEDLPELIPEYKILIVKDGDKPDSLAFKCPCGCNSIILLNLLEDARPRWNYNLTNKGKISISPSIWRKFGCKSHFFIRESRVEWV